VDEVASAPARSLTISASAAPRRTTGTRVRAGNAMSRTRSVLLAAALRLLVEHGARRTSMADIAAEAGVAKGTLYNHFRTKEDVWAAVAEAEVQAVAEACAGLPLPDALAVASQRLTDHPAVSRLAAEEPATLCAMLTVPPETPARQLAADAVRRTLADAGRHVGATDLVLRWLESHLTRRASAAETPVLLAAMLPPAPASPSPAVRPAVIELD
jgi:AcrR family transcriptional regulator